MKIRPLLLALALASSSAAFAAPAYGPVSMSFDDIPAVASYTDPIGAAYGLVRFSDAALKLDNNDGVGPYAENLPSGSSMMFVPVDSAVLSGVNGHMFGGLLSFSYTSLADVAGGVQLYSGTDGTGTLLGSIDLVGDGLNGCTNGIACNWHTASLTINGLAGSVVFTGAEAAFDNINVSTVPEPTSMALVLAALAGLGLMARRRA